MDGTILGKMAAHIAAEENASRIYRQFSAWCEQENWVGSAAFFRREAAEERQHAQEWQDYVLDRGGVVTIEPAVAALQCASLLSAFWDALNLEQQVLVQIEQLQSEAASANEWDANHWMAKYAEAGRKQIRELTVMVARLKRLAGDPAGLDAFDQELLED